jgi:hypothetical protein
MDNTQKITYKGILKFWLPLASTWLMMAFEGPYLAAIIARLPQEKFNLAAYGVSFAFGLVVEAPIIMLMSASVALVKGVNSYYDLRRFALWLNIALTSVILIICIPDIFYFLAINMLGLKYEIAKTAHLATLLLTPWPGSIGYRRFYQGILIKYGKTKYVAFGTLFRLTFMSISAFTMYSLKILPGAAVGTLSLSIGVMAEAIAVRMMSKNLIKEIKASDNDSNLPFLYILKFYIPLALTPLIGLGVYPAVTFFMGKSINAIESLAVLPVINSLVFIFRSLGLSYQEVVIALISRSKENYVTVRNFAAILGLFCLFMMGLIAFTPLSHIWFSKISGLSRDLADFAVLPTSIMTILPASTVLISFQRGILVNHKLTNPITYATALEVGLILISLTLMLTNSLFPGAVIAAISLVIGRISSTLFLFFYVRKCKK